MVSLGSDTDARNGNPTINMYLEGSVDGGSTWQTIIALANPTTDSSGSSKTSFLEDAVLTTKYNRYRVRVSPIDNLYVYTAYAHAVIVYYE